MGTQSSVRLAVKKYGLHDLISGGTRKKHTVIYIFISARITV